MLSCDIKMSQSFCHLKYLFAISCQSPRELQEPPHAVFLPRVISGRGYFYVHGDLWECDHNFCIYISNILSSRVSFDLLLSQFLLPPVSFRSASFIS